MERAASQRKQPAFPERAGKAGGKIQHCWRARLPVCPHPRRSGRSGGGAHALRRL